MSQPYPSAQGLTVDYVADTIDVILTSSPYDTADEFVSDVGVLARATLANRDDTGGVFDADDAVLPAATGIVNGVIVARNTGDDATSELLAYFDQATMGGLPLNLSNEPGTVTWPAGGILTLAEDPDEPVDGGSATKPGALQTLTAQGFGSRHSEATFPGTTVYPSPTSYPAAGLSKLGVPENMILHLLPPSLVLDIHFGESTVRRVGTLYPESLVADTRFGDAVIGLYRQELQAFPVVPATVFGTASLQAPQLLEPAAGIAPAVVFGEPLLVRADSPPLILPSRTGVRWRIVIADRSGVKLLDVTSMALEAKFSWRLNRPETCTFRLPADNELLRLNAGDGLPYVLPIVRYVFAYREERVSPSSSTLTHRLRFMGPVWQLEDQAGADGAISTVVSAFGPMQFLTRRLCVDHTGSTVRNPQNPGATPGPVFANASPTGALNNVIDWSKQTRGDMPIDVVITESTPVFPTLDWQQKSIADAMIEVAGMLEGLGYGWVYNENGRAGLELRRRVGSDKPNAIFSWGEPLGNCASVTRLVDGQTFASSVIAVGSNLAVNGAPFAVGPRNDGAIAQYGLWEVLSSYPDITGNYVAAQPSTWALLQSLGQEEVAFRSQLRQVISWKPQAGRAPEPFVDYTVGDTIRAYANKKLRGGFGGVQRVYGIDVSINDQGAEDVAVLTSQE